MNKLNSFTLLLFVALTANVFAQKFGHLNSNELFLAMPERAAIEEEIKNIASNYESQLMTMQNEFDTKLQDFQANEATMSDAIQETKRNELIDLQKRIQDFQEKATSDLGKKEKELTDPLIEKAKKAIEDVAKENNFTYIFDNSAGILLYSGGGEDVTALVKTKLGL